MLHQKLQFIILLVCVMECLSILRHPLPYLATTASISPQQTVVPSQPSDPPHLRDVWSAPIQAADRVTTVLYTTTPLTTTSVVSRTTTVLNRIQLTPPYQNEEVLRITHPPILNYFPNQVSPDGKWFAYVIAAQQPGSHEILYVSRTDGSDRRQLIMAQGIWTQSQASER